MGNSETPKGATKLFSLVLSIVFFGIFAFTIKTIHSDSPKRVRSPVIIKKVPTITRGKMELGEVQDEFQFFDLPGDLHTAQTHDIIFYSDAMWLGTDKGLVKIDGNAVTIYKQFSDWPFEWVSGVVATPHGMVVQTYVSIGNTGGKGAGTHLFNIENETWSKISPNVKAQAWLNGYLYQASSTLSRRDPSENWAKRVLLDAICKPRATKLRMESINNEIWTTGQG